MFAIRRANRLAVGLFRGMLTFINTGSQVNGGMRGSQPEGEPLYECVDCGDRQRDPDGRLCTCGGYLKNIGVGRAL